MSNKIISSYMGCLGCVNDSGENPECDSCPGVQRDGSLFMARYYYDYAEQAREWFENGGWAYSLDEIEWAYSMEELK